MKSLFLKIYGAYWYMRGYLHGLFMGMKYGSKAAIIYIEAKDKGGFDDITRAKLMKLAREYQAEDPFHRNVNDIIREFDENVSKINLGVHYY